MGTTENKSESKPLSGDERAYAFSKGIDSISDGMGNDMFSGTGYTTPSYTDPGSAKTLSSQDYGALEQSIYDSAANKLNRQWDTRKEDINQEMADRGVWASGVPIQVQEKEYANTWLPQYTDAANAAATQRYNLQNSENQMLNQFAQTSAAAKNAWETDQAQKAYDAKWRGLDYLQGLYNNTGGVVSSSSGGGWSI